MITSKPHNSSVPIRYPGLLRGTKATTNSCPSTLRGLSARQGGNQDLKPSSCEINLIQKLPETWKLGIPGWQGAIWELGNFFGFSYFFSQTTSIKTAIFNKSAFSDMKMFHYRLLSRPVRTGNSSHGSPAPEEPHAPRGPLYAEVEDTSLNSTEDQVLQGI